MKKIYFLFCLAALLAFGRGAQAQVPPGIVINFAGDTVWNTFNNCTVPDTLALFLYGTAGGYMAGDSVDVYINFGDGSDTLYKLPIYQNTYFSDYFPHTYTLPGIYSLEFIVTGPDLAADTLTAYNTVAAASQCGNIAGRVYYDDNGDCMFNGADAGIPWNFVRLLFQGNYIQGTFTDTAGYYYFSVPAGFTFEVEVDYKNPNFTPVCPAGGSYTVTTVPATNLDFATNCTTPGYDLTGNLYAWGFRPGLPSTIYYNFWNAACGAVSGTVTVTLPAGLTYVSAVPAPTSVAGQVLTYNVPTYPWYWGTWWTGNNHITVTGAPSLQIGDTLCVQMDLAPDGADLNPADNHLTYCAPVRNSCDPNEKYEAHAFWGTAPVSPGTELDYTVSFQNVGNDTAFYVAVVDTLDADLDLATLRFRGTSHPMTLRMAGTNVLKFEFLNIGLPAASVNEAESHGYVSYSITPKTGLTQGTPIDNRAHIYFDFNGAIITNTVTDVIDLTLGIAPAPASAPVVTAAPNPATGEVVLHYDGPAGAVYEIRETSGRLVRAVVLDAPVTRLDISGLTAGVYVTNLVSVTGKSTAGKLVVVR